MVSGKTYGHSRKAPAFLLSKNHHVLHILGLFTFIGLGHDRFDYDDYLGL